MQELERQAMEQYRNSNAADERQVDSGSVSREEQDCSDGRRCSGHGQCSPSKGNGEEKSTCLTIPQSVDSSSKKLKGAVLKIPYHNLRELRPSLFNERMISLFSSFATRFLPPATANHSTEAEGEVPAECLSGVVEQRQQSTDRRRLEKLVHLDRGIVEGIEKHI